MRRELSLGVGFRQEAAADFAKLLSQQMEIAKLMGRDIAGAFARGSCDAEKYSICSDVLTFLTCKAEFVKLPAPIGIGIAQALDIDATREAAFNRCLDQLRSKERERERLD